MIKIHDKNTKVRIKSDLMPFQLLKGFEIENTRKENLDAMNLAWIEYSMNTAWSKHNLLQAYEDGKFKYEIFGDKDLFFKSINDIVLRDLCLIYPSYLKDALKHKTSLEVQIMLPFDYDQKEKILKRIESITVNLDHIWYSITPELLNEVLDALKNKVDEAITRLTYIKIGDELW